MFEITCLLSDLTVTLTKVLAVVFPIYAIYSFQRRDDYELLRVCFFMSITILILGFVCTWFSGLKMWRVVGVAGDISLELIYSGWKNSFRPVIWSFLSAFVLLGVGFAGPYFKNRITKKVLEPALAVVIPTLLVLLVFSSSFIIPELFPASDQFSTPSWIKHIGNLSLASFFTFTLLGIPVLVWWAYKIKSFFISNPDYPWKKTLISYYVLCTIFVICCLILFLIAYLRDSFYYECWL